jgi:hypothetical protein
MPLTARRYIRKMRGGAQAQLLEASDGRFYIVKFQNNPQHRRVLVNELVASVFLRYLQISSAECAVIQVSEEFVRENPDACMQLGASRIPVAAGWQFASLYPGDPARLAVYDFVPDALLYKVRNLADFLGVLVFDKWVANADGRQAVFFRARLREWAPVAAEAHPLTMGFVALMIDQGFAFNGPEWNFIDSPMQGLYARKLVYESVTSLDPFEPWLERVLHFPEEVVDQASKQIPLEWLAGDHDAFERMLEKLLRRRKRVPDLLRDARLGKASPFTNWKR